MYSPSRWEIVLNLNLREDKGYTYGIRSGFDGNDTDGMFSISTSVRSEATDSALTEIYKEFENYSMCHVRINKGLMFRGFSDDGFYKRNEEGKLKKINTDSLSFRCIKETEN